MIYKCKKLMYSMIAMKVTKKDLGDGQTVKGFMCRYFEQGLCLPPNSIKRIEFI